MELFEIEIAKVYMSESGAPFTPDKGFIFNIPQEAEDLLDNILEPYGLSSFFYFDNFEINNQAPPWALVCLDREYPIAGHIAAKRPSNEEIYFVQYQSNPNPIPNDYVPNVGTLIFQEKRGLELAASRSLIFQEAWRALETCSVKNNWLVFLDPLPEKWLAEQLPGNRELYLSTAHSIGTEDDHYNQQIDFESLRSRLCESALNWQEKYRTIPHIMSAISEYDAARIIGMSEEEYAERRRGRGPTDFVHGGNRYRVRGLRREEGGGRPNSLVIHRRPTNYEWDYFIFILYNKSYEIREAWIWCAASYREYFDRNDNMTLNDMRLGENLLRR